MWPQSLVLICWHHTLGPDELHKCSYKCSRESLVTVELNTAVTFSCVQWCAVSQSTHKVIHFHLFHLLVKLEMEGMGYHRLGRTFWKHCSRGSLRASLSWLPWFILVILTKWCFKSWKSVGQIKWNKWKTTSWKWDSHWVYCLFIS